MFHKGLTRKTIVDTAREMIEESGYSAFSMRKLAERLDVKTASLYAHIEGMDELFAEVVLSALEIQLRYLNEAIGDERRDSAIRALSQGYRRFAFEHRELYRLIMLIPSCEQPVLKDASARTADRFMEVFADYGLPRDRSMHWQRILRGLMHGFISEEQAGYFSHFAVPVEESYRIGVDCVIAGLNAEKEASL